MHSRFLIPLRSVVLATAILALVASLGHATSYGDFVGTNVRFESVADQHGLYGAPTLAGDSLDFSPNEFEAACPATSGCPSSVADELSFQLRSAPGLALTDITLREAGDTTLTSFFDAEGTTRVSGTVSIRILELDGVAVAPIETQVEMAFTPGDTFEAPSAGSQTLIWTGVVSVDLEPLIAQQGQSGGATLVSVSLANSLKAEAASGAATRIELKDLDGVGVAAGVAPVVPEPGAASLFGLAIALLTSVRGRLALSRRG